MKAQLGTHAPTGLYMGWVTLNGKAVASALYPRRDRNKAFADAVALLKVCAL